jgi:hypothetical protein
MASESLDSGRDLQVGVGPATPPGSKQQSGVMLVGVCSGAAVEVDPTPRLPLADHGAEALPEL